MTFVGKDRFLKIYKWIEDGGIGSYEFKHDDELDLYYIEKMKFERKNK